MVNISCWTSRQRWAGCSLPISLKDILNVTGLESTTGYVAWIGNVQSEDDILVGMLHEAGAVFYCKTNVPQTLMSGECVNFIFGRTSRPWNTDLSARGSSGGEGSLISLGGSPLGVGSDIAGSIRTSANFNDIQHKIYYNFVSQRFQKHTSQTSALAFLFLDNN